MAKEKRTGRKRRAQTRREQILLRINIVLAIAIVLVCFGIAVKENEIRNRIDPATIVVPEWIEQDFLVRNPYSRAGEPLTQVKDIVVHYVANPGTSHIQNRNYFNGLASQEGVDKTSASSHFIIGLDGTILQCMPLSEVAYANYPRNYDTISIECCHPDETGAFTEETKAALIRLTAWLCDELRISEKHMIRHYDVSGKVCPKYYVDQEDKWTELRGQVRDEIRRSRK